MDGGARAIWVTCTSRICVCRSLQSFGEASRLPRMTVACRSVYGRRSCAGISQRSSHPQQSLWRHCNMVSLLSHHIHLLLCSTCFSAPSRGISLWRLWLCSWCCLEVRVRLNCLCGACNTCSTLGWLIVQCPCGIVSAVFQGRAVVIASFLLALSFFFVLYGWLAYLHCGVERGIS